MKIETLFLLNRDFAYYYADFYFYYEQSVIATVLTALALVKKSNKNSFIQERNIMLFTAVYTGFDVRFLLEVSEELISRTLTWELSSRHAFDLLCLFSEIIF